MFVRLLRLPPDERARYDIGTLRHVLHTGAPCRPQVKHDMIDWFGPVIWEQYGSTETGVVAPCDTAEWLAHPGTVGRPFLSSEIRIFSTSGAPCPPGTPGEIYARVHGTRHVVPEQGLGVVGDASVALEPGPGAHDHPRGELAPAAWLVLRLGDQHPRSCGSRLKRRAAPGQAAAKHHHVIVGHGATYRRPGTVGPAPGKSDY